MDSGFNEKELRKIPKNLDECIVSNTTVNRLRALAENLEAWGAILLRILIVVGILASIEATIEAAHAQEKENILALVAVFVSSVLQWGIYAIIEYCTYRVLALLSSSLAIITENTTISANVALLQASRNSQNSNDSAPASVNPTQTPPVVTKKAPKESKPVGSIWICSACGTQNLPDSNICRACKKEK